MIGHQAEEIKVSKWPGGYSQLKIRARITDLPFCPGRVIARPCLRPPARPTCRIAHYHHALTKAHIIRGTMFCHACPDAAHIPPACNGTCDPARHRFGTCRLFPSCPCATELTPRRAAAFRRWLRRNFALPLSPSDLSPLPLLRNPNML